MARQNEAIARLSPQQRQLVLMVIAAGGKTVRYRELVNVVNAGSHNPRQVVRVQMSRARNMLLNLDASILIENIHDVGYRLAASE